MRINLREESKEPVARWFVSLRARTPVDERQPGGGESGPPLDSDRSIHQNLAPLKESRERHGIRRLETDSLSVMHPH